MIGGTENRYTERDGNQGIRRGNNVPKEINEGGRPALSKEGAGSWSVGGRLTTSTDKRVKREETERAKGRNSGEDFETEGGGPSLSPADGRVHTGSS